MFRKLYIIFSAPLIFTLLVSPLLAQSLHDTTKVMTINQLGQDYRFSQPEKTIEFGRIALRLAEVHQYKRGIAESYRVIGIGEFYRNANDKAIDNFLTSLNHFNAIGDEEGQARVYNNIGNLYRDIDYNKGLEYFQRSLKIANRLKMTDLIAGLHLNIGAVFQRNRNFNRAIAHYERSRKLFEQLQNQTGLTLCLQNLAALYASVGDYSKAEETARETIRIAKANDQYIIIAATNLTLSSVYQSLNDYPNARRALQEGERFSKLVKDQRLEYDYLVAFYRLEDRYKNYEKALHYLAQAYQQDSITYRNTTSEKIGLLEAQHRQLERQRENELTIAKQKYTQILFWASSLVAILAFFVIFLLIKNVKKSSQTNKELTRLHEEVSSQKDDLDRTNQNLENIIAERTRDLQIKNQKLSEYSSHLSHQIRSPVATLKGLMLLEKDNLIDRDEFIEQMGACINNLDDKIININENLNNPEKPGFDDMK